MPFIVEAFNGSHWVAVGAPQATLAGAKEVAVLHKKAVAGAKTRILGEGGAVVEGGEDDAEQET